MKYEKAKQLISTLAKKHQNARQLAQNLSNKKSLKRNTFERQLQ